MVHSTSNSTAQKNRTIVLPLVQAQYDEVVISHEGFREHLDTFHKANPELFSWNGCRLQ